MDTKAYFQQFGLSPDEMDLHILNCVSSQILPDIRVDSKNISSVTEKTLPTLAFPDQSFNLALCANILFVNENSLMVAQQGNNTNTATNKKQERIDFHLETIKELTRVASEARIFPLIDSLGKPSLLLGPILIALQEKGYGVELREVMKPEISVSGSDKDEGDVGSESGQAGQAMLRVWNDSCEL